MSTKDVKVGEEYNVRVKVEHIDEDGWIKVRTNEKSISFILSPREAEFISPLPKYDPCREFQAGDKVRMRKRDGRLPYCMSMHEHIVPSDTICTVVRCELNGFIAVEYNNGYNPVVHFSFLELVTPVEELEPYSVTASTDDWCVQAKQSSAIISRYSKRLHPHALEAAEAERDRLNAEYRKELK